jgi:hypothetical protein
VGGTRAPDQVVRIDFGKPHDFHFRIYGSGTEQVFRKCILIGFTTPTDDQGNAIGGQREFDHDRWLVLRQADGRVVYAPREGLQYIIESEP